MIDKVEIVITSVKLEGGFFLCSCGAAGYSYELSVMVSVASEGFCGEISTMMWTNVQLLYYWIVTNV